MLTAAICVKTESQYKIHVYKMYIYASSARKHLENLVIMVNIFRGEIILVHMCLSFEVVKISCSESLFFMAKQSRDELKLF